MKPSQHYLAHIVAIKANGPMPGYFARSLKRTIGRYKRLVNARTNVDVNAGMSLAGWLYYD